MIKKVLVIGVFLASWINVSAVIIKGSDSTYAGQLLEFKIPKDPITGIDTVLGSTLVKADGSFSVELDIQETMQVYSFPGKYKLYLFIEPGKTYNVILPAFQKKEAREKLNPYFRPIEYHLGLKEFSKDELNIQIRMFLDAYIPYYKKHIDKVFTDKDFEELDKDIKKMDKPFEKSTNKFFNDFRTYKYGMLRMLAFQHKSKAISDNFYKDKSFLYYNSAYIDLFIMLYDQYFTHFSKADEDKKLIRAISVSKTYDAVKSVLMEDEVLKPEELLNMVILKCLYDEFYDDNYARNSLLAVLDSFIESVQDPYQVYIAKNIKGKVTKLLTGYSPPDFELYDMDSNLVNLANFKGKHVYLNFCSCFSYSCLKEFVMLKKLYEKHSNYLEIVTIVIDDEFELAQDFVKRSGYAWTFLHFENKPQIIQDYDIRAYPTYYLIDNKGKLAISPAPSPIDGFEMYLFKELRSKGIL
jgi:peroxiredoxin